jgi:hypothetical protein
MALRSAKASTLNLAGEAKSVFWRFGLGSSGVGGVDGVLAALCMNFMVKSLEDIFFGVLVADMLMIFIIVSDVRPF